MKYIGKIDGEEFVFDAPFDLEEGEQVQFVKQLGPKLSYPPDPNDPKPFVVQVHARGISTHLDFRFQRTKEELEGWTVAEAKPGFPYPLVTWRAVKEFASEQKYWKLSLTTGKVLPREVKTTIRGEKRIIARPGGLFAERKATEIPSAWIAISGSTVLPPLWPESVVKDWHKFPSFVRNELRNRGWSLPACERIIRDPLWKEWKTTRDPKILEKLRVSERLSPDTPQEQR